MHAGEDEPALPGSRPLTLTLAASAWRAHQRHPLFFVAVTREGAVRSGGADGNIMQHRINVIASERHNLLCDAGMRGGAVQCGGADGSTLQQGTTPDASQRGDCGSRATVRGHQAELHSVQTHGAETGKATGLAQAAAASGGISTGLPQRPQQPASPVSAAAITGPVEVACGSPNPDPAPGVYRAAALNDLPGPRVSGSADSSLQVFTGTPSPNHDPCCGMGAAANGLPGLLASKPAGSFGRVACGTSNPDRYPGGCMGAAADGLPGPAAGNPAGSPGRLAFTQLRRRQRRKVLDWDMVARKPRASQGLQARMPVNTPGMLRCTLMMAQPC